MNSTLIKKIDKLEEAHQEMKRRWIDWARDQFPDQGIGSGHNSQTVDFLKKEGSDAVAVFSRLKQEIGNDILEIEDLKEKYLIYRELYFIHPSFHEHWLLFDLHLKLSAEKIISGRGGLSQFLNDPVRTPTDLQRITTYSLRRLILIENLLSGQLGVSLFDETPLPDKKIPEMARKFENFSQMKIEEKVEVMPDIFSVVLTLLEKTHYQSLHPEIILSNVGWTYWAACCINEGPIFKKINPKSRQEIFKSIRSTEARQFHKEIEKFYEIVPFSIETVSGTVEPNRFIDFNSIHPLSPISNRQKILSDVKVSEKSRYSSMAKVKFSEEKSLDSTSAIDLYSLICEKLDPLFGKLVCDQKTKFSYRTENKINYPNRKELDMISLFKPTTHSTNKVRFLIYPHILKNHLGLQNTDRIINALPEGSVLKQGRKNPHKGDIYIAGFFSNEGEIEKFVNLIVSGKTKDLPGSN